MLTPTTFKYRKWDGSPHWIQPAIYLGEDDFGDWFYQKPGAINSRPGKSVEQVTEVVMFVPRSKGYVARFFTTAREDGRNLFIDLVHDVYWSKNTRTITAIDMDLDIVRDRSGVWVDDRNDFDHNRIMMKYPAVLVNEIENNVSNILDMLELPLEPFGNRSIYWFNRAHAMMETELSDQTKDDGFHH